MTNTHKNHLEQIEKQNGWGVKVVQPKMSDVDVVNAIRDLKRDIVLRADMTETARIVENYLTDLIGDIEVEDHSYYNEQETDASLKAWHESRVL